MYKVMIVEDDEEVRSELQTLLERNLYEAIAVDHFNKVDETILNSSADLVLLDVNLPVENGLRICTKVRKTSEIPVIFVTSQNTSMDELNCIMQGGDDFIAKPYQPSILLARIAAVLRRTGKKDSDHPIRKMVHKQVTLDVIAGIMTTENGTQDLSKTELKILYYLIEHKGEIVPRIDLVEYLWDNQVYIDDNTLSVNVTRIRSKLDQIGVYNFIETKRGLGYRV